ncbi:MAG: cytochrome c [Verrucomicrobia bacterium]|nr:cytochrome c [Verrucomicrobiota bacterium]
MNTNKFRLLAWLASASFTLVVLLLIGCSTPTATTGKSANAASTTQSGATLWAQNCGHCHNIRAPDSFSDAQWDVAMLHMRVRANLTAEEHRQILAFLKSAH